MKLGITGGGGFLGYHICNRLYDKFDEIVIVDIAPIDPKEYPQNVKIFNADVRNKEVLFEIFADVDYIIHAAAALPLWKKKDIISTNVEGTKNVLEVAKKKGIRVVFISSTSVYGIPKKHPIYEEDELIGVGPYGKSKIAAEKLCIEYKNKYKMCIPIIRPKTFIGTGRLGVFQILYDWIKSGKKIPIIGNGKNRYQLLEVDDLVDAIYLTLVLPEEKVNDIFNIGAKEFGTVLEDLGKLCAFAKSGATVMPTPAPIVKTLLKIFWLLRISPLYKWVYETADKDSFVAIEKAQRMLGWMPKYSNAEALIRSYKWYLEHFQEDQHLPEEGITHRAPWKQGILKIFKKIL